jgi:N-acetylmuramoyl-L-alanine amidase CwlA
MQIKQQYIPVPSLRRSGQKILGTKFIVCHDTGNDGSTAQNNADYYKTSANVMQASAHAFVDDQGVIEVIPATEKAWHVRYSQPQDNQMFGGDANDYSLGIELCYSTTGKFNSVVAYNNYVEYIRGLCAQYNINPLTNLVSHATLDPTRRTDPINAFGKIGKTWNDFIADVSIQNTKPTLADGIKKIEEGLAIIKSLNNI